MRTSMIGLLAVVSFSTAVPALAQDAPETAPAAEPAAEEESGPFSISGNITLVSDYRFRAVTLSDKDFAIQPTVTISHESGFYVGTWASNLDDTPTYGEVEIDLYAGWGKEIASGTSVDIGAVYYYYPDGTGASDYWEPYASVTKTLGPVSAKAGIAWAPSQDSTGNFNYFYYYGQLSGEVPGTPVSLMARVGSQDQGPFSYLEWAIGATAAVGPFTAGVQYVDADQRSVFAPGDAKAGVVFSLAFNF